MFPSVVLHAVKVRLMEPGMWPCLYSSTFLMSMRAIEGLPMFSWSQAVEYYRARPGSMRRDYETDTQDHSTEKNHTFIHGFLLEPYCGSSGISFSIPRSRYFSARSR